MTSRALVAGARRSATLIFAASFLSGCGANTAITPSDPPGSPANITGNWVLQANFNTGGSRSIAAYLSSNAGTVSGNAVVEGVFPLYCANGCCGGPFYVFNGALTGTVDAEGNLTLGSTVPGGGPVFTMTATASGGTLTNGIFTLTGSCPAQGTMNGTEYPTLDGTYAGTLSSQSTGQSFGITATVAQSSTLNSRGFFDVTGTASLSGYPCATSAVVATPLDQNSGFLGNSFAETMNATPAGTFNLSGGISPDGTIMAATYEFALMGSSCNLDLGTGTLTLQ